MPEKLSPTIEATQLQNEALELTESWHGHITLEDVTRLVGIIGRCVEIVFDLSSEVAAAERLPERQKLEVLLDVEQIKVGYLSAALQKVHEMECGDGLWNQEELNHQGACEEAHVAIEAYEYKEKPQFFKKKEIGDA